MLIEAKITSKNKTKIKMYANIKETTQKRAVDTCSILLDMNILSIAFFIGDEKILFKYNISVEGLK